MTSSSRRLFPFFLMLGLAGQVALESLLLERAVLAQPRSPIFLKLRKEPKHIDVMLNGIGGSSRVLQAWSTNTSWRGEITSSHTGLLTKEVLQEVAMTEAGLASVRLRGSGPTYQLEVTSVTGTVLPKPQILATGDDLVFRFIRVTPDSVTRQTSSFDLLRPGRISQPISAPPLQSRALAPPLGDISVGSMLIRNRSFVQLSGPPVSLTFNNTPVKDALMALARLVLLSSSAKALYQRADGFRPSTKLDGRTCWWVRPSIEDLGPKCRRSFG